MVIIETIGYPNFIVSAQIESTAYTFRFHSFRGMLYCDVTVNDVVRHRSVRCINNVWLIPFGVTEGGNFRCESETGDYPTGDGMGDTCHLVYYTQEEVEAM